MSLSLNVECVRFTVFFFSLGSHTHADVYRQGHTRVHTETCTSIHVHTHTYTVPQFSLCAYAFSARTDDARLEADAPPAAAPQATFIGFVSSANVYMQFHSWFFCVRLVGHGASNGAREVRQSVVACKMYINIQAHGCFSSLLAPRV